MSFLSGLKDALKEVQEKPETHVEKETANKWAARAAACYQLFKQTQDLKWKLRAEDYRHEAIEHASLARDKGQTVKVIESELEKYERS